MTCIVGIADGNMVYMAGDRGVSDGDSILSMSRPKIATRGNWVYGYAGNLGKGQLFDLIDLPILEDNDDPYIVLRLDIVSELKKAIESFANPESDETDFLVGAKGRLFELSTADWGVIEVKETAIGSGNSYALGSLSTTYNIYSTNITSEMRVRLAVDAALEFSPSCAKPVDYLTL